MHLLLPAISPGALIYAWFLAGDAQGWGGWAYGYAMVLIIRASALSGAVLVGIALYRRYRNHSDAYWWLASALIAGSPVLLLLGRDALG